jgi:hypothetical protein
MLTHLLIHICLFIFTYVCYLLMLIYLCSWFLMFAYVAYVCLYMFIYLVMGYDISEGIFCWYYEAWKKGKYLVGI